MTTDRTSQYTDLAQSADFVRLRARSRTYLTAMTAGFLGVFTAVVLVAGYRPEVMAVEVAGRVNLGLLLAAGLIVMPAVLSVVHLRYARRHLDPLAERVRAAFDGPDPERAGHDTR